MVLLRRGPRLLLFFRLQEPARQHATSLANLVDNVLLDLQQSTSCTLDNIITVGGTNPITVKSINSPSYVQYELISDEGSRHFKVPSTKILLLENVELKAAPASKQEACWWKTMVI